MINSFKNYLKAGKVRKKTIDPEEAKSLLEKALNRLEYIKDKRINKKTATFILEDAYEAIREAAQSLMSIKGYKPYSHEATIAFIKEFHKSEFKEYELRKFDQFRKLRNDSVYRATEIMIKDAKSALSFAKKFIKKIEKLQKKLDKTKKDSSIKSKK
jgi:uncharacterized protein (UPF0332 family)